MIEKSKLLVTFDAEQSFEFMRFVFHGKDLETKKNLEICIQKIKDDAGPSLFAALTAAVTHPTLDMGDYFTGMLAGVALCTSAGRPNERVGVIDFLKTLAEKSDNVSDISSAFRKKTT